MAYLVLVINLPNDSINQLNPQIQEPTKVSESINNCVNLLSSVNGGLKSGSVQATIRDSDPSVSTSGSGSTQYTYSNL